MKQFIKKHKVFNPDPAKFDIYNKLFVDYKNIYHALKGAYIDANNERFNEY